MEHLKKYINEIKDFPKEGIVFKDINPIYKEPKRWNELTLPLQKQISTLLQVTNGPLDLKALVE